MCSVGYPLDLLDKKDMSFMDYLDVYVGKDDLYYERYVALIR